MASCVWYGSELTVPRAIAACSTLYTLSGARWVGPVICCGNDLPKSRHQNFIGIVVDCPGCKVTDRSLADRTPTVSAHSAPTNSMTAINRLIFSTLLIMVIRLINRRYWK